MEMLTLTGHITDCGSGHSGPCATVSLRGHTLAVYSSIPLPLNACAKVEEGNAMWMGEVWVCEPSGSGYSIEVETSAMLSDVAGVDRLAARFQHERPSRTRGLTHGADSEARFTGSSAKSK